jgi:hypothetical protein
MELTQPGHRSPNGEAALLPPDPADRCRNRTVLFSSTLVWHRLAWHRNVGHI